MSALYGGAMYVHYSSGLVFIMYTYMEDNGFAFAFRQFGCTLLRKNACVRTDLYSRTYIESLWFLALFYNIMVLLA